MATNSYSKNVKSFLKDIYKDDRFNREIVHQETFESKPGLYKSLNPPLPDSLQSALRSEGIHSLYTHQVEGIDKVRAAKNVVTVTPTASGKSLTYLVPILEKMANNPDARAILLFPIKALAQDQKMKIENLLQAAGYDQIKLAVYDGDTPRNERGLIRKNPPNLILTNPDMLHQGLLPFHTQWEKLFRNLHFVVIDELHGYKGVFGSNVLQIMRRLRRICRFYRAEPQFIAASATIANPGELAENIVGLPFDVIDKNGAPSAERNILFVNPISSLYTTTVRLLSEAVNAGLKTIVFTKARKITELIHSWTLQSNPDLMGRLSAYRSGYLPSERREIEQKLHDGELDGVIATSALEMGIDIGGLDVAILVGYPGSIASTWQRGGRVGRKERDSAIFLLALPDALDQYFMRNPADFFGRSVEAAVVDIANPYLLERHLPCAAQEVPLRRDEGIYDPEQLEISLKELVKKGDLLEAANGSVFFSKSKQPQRNVDIRGGDSSISVFEEKTRRLIGKVNQWQAMTECHPGAVYLHHGASYLITKLEMGAGEAWATKKEMPYYTTALTEKETEILEVFETKNEKRYGVSLGKLKVTERVIGFEKRSTTARDKISAHELELPPVTYETIGIWFEPPVEAIGGLIDEKFHPMGSLHATEHSCLALLPLFTMSDRNDLGGISFTRHQETGNATIFLYDGHPGGVGLANKAYEILQDLFERVLHLVETCPCEDGCPSCIHSPKCGHGNNPLDKQGCIRLLKHLTNREELVGDPELVYEMFGTKGNAQTKPVVKKKLEKVEEAVEIPYENKLHLIKDKDVVVFDIETQLSAEEVGGWHNAHLMRVALAVTYEFLSGEYKTYYEENVDELIERLFKADIVVGFNNINFDNSVLMGYSGQDLRGLNNLDLLQEIVRCIGHRVKLDSLGKATLGTAKTADGLQSLQWWKEGKVEEIEKYCRMDVELTAKLFELALKQGFLLVDHFEQGSVKIAVDINLPE